MATVTGRASVTPNFSQTPASGILATSTFTAALPLEAIFQASGTAADQVDLLHAKTYSFTSGSTTTLDLTSLTDLQGAAVNFARIRFIAVKVKSTTDAASLTLGAAGSDPWAAVWGTTGTHKVFPSSSSNGGWLVITAPNTTGMAVSGTSKSLLMTASAHAFDADVIIAGCSA